MKTKLLFFSIGVSALILLKFIFSTAAIAAEKTQVNRPPTGYNPSNYFLPMRPGLYPSLEDFMARAIKIPIYFWGKAVDEQNNPIADAHVEFSIGNKISFEKTERRFTKTDKEGLFSLTDARGASLYVNVTKEGYYRIDKSNGTISYVTPPTTSDRPIPTPDNPSIFILKKKGVAEPLIVSGFREEIPTNGTPIEISLGNAKGRVSDKPDVIFQVWIDKPVLTSSGEPDFNFPWRICITVPGGGWVERKNEFDFIAPEQGYQPVINFNKQTGDPKSKNFISRDVFLKLHDGSYARAKIEITLSIISFLSIESYLNPSGSRNLEYDEAKQLKN